VTDLVGAVERGRFGAVRVGAEGERLWAGPSLRERDLRADVDRGRHYDSDVWVCSVCGDEISEWAVRCSNCGSSVEDAKFVEDSPQETFTARVATDWASAPTGRGAVFFGRRRTAGRLGSRVRARSRSVWAIVIAVAVVVVGTLAILLSRSGREAGLPGFVLSVEGNGSFVVSAPNGSAVTPISGDALAAAVSVVPAVDRRYLIASTGRLIDVQGDTFRFTGRSVPVPQDAAIVGLADHDQTVITVGPGHEGVSPILATRFGQQPIMLGTAHTVAADPQHVGVIASVASPRLQDGQALGYPPGSPAFPVDARVELLDAGNPPVMLASAENLNAALRAPTTTPVEIDITPDPSGQRFALTVTPATATVPWAGIVVVDRHGTILGQSLLPSGLAGAVTWSPDGRSLGYPQRVAGHLDVAVWTIHRSPTVRTGPTSGSVAGAPGVDCLWSPNSGAILCAVGTSGTPANTQWLSAQISQPQLVVTSGPILPLAWLSGPTPRPQRTQN
jgi:hypothetical protein